MHKNIIQYLGLLVFSFIIAYYLPDLGHYLRNGMKIWLFLLLFMSGFSLKIKDILKLNEDKTFLFFVAFVRLVVLPLAVYEVAGLFIPEYRTPLTLLVLAPVGVTSMVFTNILGGKISFTLALTTITGLLAPIWIPIFFKVFMEGVTTMSWLQMTIDFIIVLVLPLVLSELIQLYVPKVAKKTTKLQKGITFLFLTLIMVSSFSSYRDYLLTASVPVFFFAFLATFFLFFALSLVGWGISIYRKREETIAIMLSFLLTNYALAIYLSTTFFGHQPQTLLLTSVAILPWNLSLLLLDNIISVRSNKK